MMHVCAEAATVCEELGRAAARRTPHARAWCGLFWMGRPSGSKIGPVFPAHLCQPDPQRGPLVVLRAAEFELEQLGRASISKHDDFEYALHRRWSEVAPDPRQACHTYA